MRSGWTMAVAIALVACGGSPDVADERAAEDAAVAEDGPTTDAGPGWWLLTESEVGAAAEPALVVIERDDDLAAAWRAAGVTAGVPSVDFDHTVVVVLTTAFGDGCRPIFAEVDIRADRLDAVELQFVAFEPGHECGRQDRWYSVAVGIDRDLLEPGFTIGWQGERIPIG